MYAGLTLIFGFLAIVSLFAACAAESPGVLIFVLIFGILATCFSVQANQVISVTNTVTPGTVIKTPNAVIAEIRVGDRIERAIFTDIPTYQHATPQTRIIWRETETSWGKTGVIVLDL